MPFLFLVVNCFLFSSLRRLDSCCWTSGSYGGSCHSCLSNQTPRPSILSTTLLSSSKASSSLGVLLGLCEYLKPSCGFEFLNDWLTDSSFLAAANEGALLILSSILIQGRHVCLEFNSVPLCRRLFHLRLVIPSYNLPLSIVCHS